MRFVPAGEPLYRELGRRIRDARRGAELTQEALAGRLGLSRTSITNIERGIQHIPVHVLFDLGRALGVTVMELLPPEQEAQRGASHGTQGGLGDLPEGLAAALKKSVESTFADESQRESVYEVVRRHFDRK